ncbi:hypothetical protein EVAR_68031_1 [Eumeta japonica]|uniref:Trichohyalin-plectin-homology domain-containing protein n=1 Tax=Eumeta variegata TaxID=151549 RepID=A0A4C1SGS5_EUMVA|nr:hypothetical protein EVAR_68031_1 [Eumeta japonica]
MRKRADLIKRLQEQEYLEKNMQDEVAEIKKERSIKRETKDVLTWQMQSRIDAATQERAREVEFRKNAEKKAYEEAQKEREKEMQVKERRRRYAEELKQQILNNEVRRKRAREEEEQRVRNVFEYGRAWSAQVEEERKRIVQEHVPHVLGHLQKGVIQPDDLPAVKEGVQKNHEQLTPLDIDFMMSGRRQKYPKSVDAAAPAASTAESITSRRAISVLIQQNAGRAITNTAFKLKFLIKSLGYDCALAGPALSARSYLLARLICAGSLWGATFPDKSARRTRAARFIRVESVMIPFTRYREQPESITSSRMEEMGDRRRRTTCIHILRAAFDAAPSDDSYFIETAIEKYTLCVLE